MIDYDWVLGSKEQLMLRLGAASYGDAPPATRATALAMGMLSSVSDVGGYTATIAADLPTINFATNVDRRVPYTMGETLAALGALRDMEVLQATTRMIGSLRVQFLDCRGLVPRVPEPSIDGTVLPPLPDEAGQVESETIRPDGREAA